jgi:prepilin-type N-terminal cleavage/methylation domain-containing protein
MSQSGTGEKRRAGRRQPGFTLLELIVVVAVLVTVSGIVMTIMFRMSMAQGSVTNRTEMHSSVRSATELMQQEIGQAGRAALPSANTYTLNGAGGACPGLVGSYVVCGNGASATPSVSSTSGMFNGMQLVIGPDATAGPSRETVALTGVGAGTISALFQDPHDGTAPINVQGTFPAGVIPPGGNKILSVSGSSIVITTLTGTDAAPGQGSTAYILKLFGDINADGNMVYVEYWCKTGTAASPGNLYRNVMAFDAANKPAVTSSQILLPNILSNQDAAGNTLPCFSYQVKAVQNDTYVVDVAVTLTVQTQNKDPQTGVYQQETKALLNVSPRNVFEAWQTSSMGVVSRLQPMPQTVLTLAGQATQ